MKVNVTLDTITATGFQSAGIIPAIITSKLVNDESGLISINYEANPLNSRVDHRVLVRGKAIEVVYDGKTIHKLYNCFTLPTDAKLLR